jgi:uncharacterized membrane protein
MSSYLGSPSSFEGNAGRITRNTAAQACTIQGMIDYLGSLLILIAIVVLFFALGRRRYIQFGGAQVALRVLVALPLLISAIALHFMRTNEATAMLPPIFPAGIFPSPAFLVIATGVLEVLGAIGIFVPKVRRSAALWIAIMMVMIFPVNVFVAGQTFAGLQMPTVPVRLTMQLIYIWMVLIAGFGLPRLGNRASKSESYSSRKT